MSEIKQAAERKPLTAVTGCAHRHGYHAMPPGGWMNDPNGFVYFQNRYHLFYQYNPFAPQWGLMYWGHCVSDDLVRWEALPIALSPDKPYDENGCFSGTAIVHEGSLYLFYTGNALDGSQTQCIAVSRDGVRFTKYKNNPVIRRPPETGKTNHFRDPCVFQRGERFYMAVGNSQVQTRRGQVVLYESRDLLNWAYLNTIAANGDGTGYMWECPSLFPLGGKDVLIISPQGMKPGAGPLRHGGYFVGRLDYQTGVYTHGLLKPLDYGPDFYAAQTTQAADGRLLMIAWMNMWDTPMPTARCRWAGGMTLPRVLSLENGCLRSRPVQELARYRELLFSAESIAVSQLPPLRGNVCELLVQLDTIQTDTFEIKLFCSADGEEYAALRYEKRTQSIRLDRRRSGEGAGGVCAMPLSGSPETLEIRVFLDRSSLEVFANGGEAVMTARVYPKSSSDRIRFLGNAQVKRVAVWSLDTAMQTAE